MNSDPITQPLSPAPARRLSDGFIVTLIMIVAAVTIAAVVWRLQSRRYEAPLAAAQPVLKEPAAPQPAHGLSAKDEDLWTQQSAVSALMFSEFSKVLALHLEHLDEAERKAHDAGLALRIHTAQEPLRELLKAATVHDQANEQYLIDHQSPAYDRAEAAWKREVNRLKDNLLRARMSVAEWKP